MPVSLFQLRTACGSHHSPGVSLDLHARLKCWLLPGLVLGYLWFVLIRHVRVEWTVNPQYSYGWVVPILCVGLVWRRWEEVRGQKSEGRGQRAEARGKRSEVRGRFSAFSFQLSAFTRLWSVVAFVLLAFLWLPTRLIQEAVPEWRLVSWLLALEVVGLTLLAVHQWPGAFAKAEIWKAESRKQKTGFSCSAFQRSSTSVAGISAFRFPLSAFLFPLCFFLVAVPWPTIIEGPLIQGLTRANAGTTVELLGWFGIPAIQQGNVIEISTGMVGIDEACSGIRSLQSTLMISLFLGELYRLTVFRRTGLVFAGFALAFLFNVCRTFILVSVAAKEGIPAIQSWHDPAGVSIMLACLFALWALGVLLRNQKAESSLRPVAAYGPEGNQKSASGSVGPTLRPGNPTGWKRAQRSAFRFPRSAFQFSAFSFRLCTFSLLAWLILVEVSVALWYRSRERMAGDPIEWSILWPVSNPSFASQPIADNARTLLRFDDGGSGTWREQDGTRWQAFYFQWSPGKVAGYLAKRHTPEACLTGLGYRLRSASEVKFFAIDRLRLPFRHYVFDVGPWRVHVFHCRWEQGVDERSYVTEEPSAYNLFRGIWRGRGNLGQKVLQVAVWGMDEADQAEAAVVRQLEGLVKVETLKR